MEGSGWDDCCSFCDDDGQLYFIATNFEPDPINHKKYNIHLFKMTPDGKSIMESDKIIYQSQGSEANKLYKINGMYYHYFSEVKTEGRVIMMERSKSL
jgi:beta-xylosidase